MRTEAFRDWLKARRWNGKPLTSVASRISIARRFERSMRELGQPYDDLDAAYDADRMEAAMSLLRDLCRSTAQTGEGPASLVGVSTIAAQRMNNMAAAVRNYRQFREADAAPTPDWPALDDLRDAFLDRVPEFERFTSTDNGYERVERTYKDAIAVQARDIAASPDDDEQAGRRIYRALIPSEGPLLRWQTDDDFARKLPALAHPFYAAIGRLARDERPVVDAIITAAATFAALRAQGATTLTLGQIASIAITVAGVVRPAAAAPFKMTKARELAALLTGDPIFRGNTLERGQLERWLELLRRMEAVMRDEWGWEPRDLLDVQGFAWAALDEGWTEGADAAMVLARFDANPAFREARAAWSAERVEAFAMLADAVHEAGLDWWFVDKAPYELRFGRKDAGRIRAKRVLGYIGEPGPWLGINKLEQTRYGRALELPDANWAALTPDFAARFAALVAGPELATWWRFGERPREGLWPEQAGFEPVSAGGDEDDPEPLEDRNHWFVGASYGKTDDQSERFLREGVWQVSTPTDRQREQVMAMRAGDPIAIKAAFVQRDNLPFDAGGRRVSVMRIKARGTVVEPSRDGETVRVDWEPEPAPRDWYFYTYQPTIWQVTPAKEMARKLIRFAFDGEAQDIPWFLSRWNVDAEPEREEPSAVMSADPVNLILHGPPGTGKTFRTVAEAVRLARGLAPDDALLVDPTRRGELRAAYEDLRAVGQIRIVTFHQSYGYEEFVEGLRPEPLPGGGFALTPRAGVFRRIAEDAEQSPEEHVLVIDEINRANISKVFGELITLIEADKRIGAREETRLTLPHSGTAFGVPANLHIIGTMNSADRSIALIDKALRRRFTFREMMPEYDIGGMRDEVADAGVTLADVLRVVNDRIEYLLDREHQVGHGWLLGCDTRAKLDATMRDKVVPLIAEYFFDDWGRTADVLGGRENNPFLRATTLPPPPGMAEEGVRTRWTVRPAFAADAYRRLVAGG